MSATVTRPLAVVERNALAYRRLWKIFMTGFFDPVLFLFSIGFGVGGLVGEGAHGIIRVRNVPRATSHPATTIADR